MPIEPTDKLVIPFVTGTATQWSSSGAILPAGVPGFDTTNKTFKVGDGVSGWASLPVMDNKVNAMVMVLDSVDGGLTFAATTTPALTSTVLGDGNLRRFRIKFNQSNVPNGLGQTKVTFPGSATGRVIQTFDQKNIPKGGVSPGIYYDAWVGDVDGQFRMWVNVSSVIMPEDAAVADCVEGSSKAADAKRRGSSFSGKVVAGDYDALVLPNSSNSVNVGLQGADNLVQCVTTGANIDLTWIRPGTSVEVLVANAAGTASATLELPSGATVIGVTASQLYSMPDQSRVRFSRATVQTVDLWHIEVIHGSISAVAGTPAARARCLLLGGQSLALRFAQGYGPMALEAAFKALGDDPSTRVLNTAAGSSSLFYENDNTVGKTNHWWDERTNIAGPLAIAAVSTINAHLAAKPVGEPNPELMCFNIGQNDADDIAETGTTTMATVRDHYRKVAAYIRTNTGLSSLIFAVDLLGADDGGAYTDQQCQLFRRAQLQACKTDLGADDPLVRPGAEFFDLPRAWDDVHICLKGQTLQAQRYADLWKQLVDGLVQDSVKLQGVEFISHSFTSPDTHEVRLRSDYFSGVRYGFRRPTAHVPAGISLLPNAVPTLADLPYGVKSWAVVGTGITNELILRLVTRDASSDAVPVLNWGCGKDEAELSRMVRSVLTDRGLRSYDPRPLV